MRFRTFVFLALLVTAAVSVFAQVPVTEEHKLVFFNRAVAGIAAEAVNDELIQAVRSALNLSDVQVNAVQTLLKMRQQTAEQIMESVHETQRKLEDLTSQKNPNPTEVGMAFLASRAVHEQMQASEEKFRTDFKALLNAGQRATLDKLKTE